MVDGGGSSACKVWFDSRAVLARSSSSGASLRSSKHQRPAGPASSSHDDGRDLL